MHKSGTSMMAGVLKILGVNIGKKLAGPKWSNPLGHFENIKFLELNDKILEAAGGSWDNPPKKEKILALKEKFSKEIKELIKKEKSEIWGWKDPRTSLTIELFLPYLDNPYFLVYHRNFQAIAEELKKRDKMEIKQGINLSKIYEEYINDFFENHPELKKFDLYYEEVIKEREKWIKKIIEFLQIKPTEKQYEEAIKFIRPQEEMQKLSKKMKRIETINRIKYLTKKGITQPWKIPIFLFEKMEVFIKQTNKKRI